MRQLTPREKADIAQFKETTGTDVVELERYLTEQWEWDELWDFNFGRTKPLHLECKCRFEALRASGRRQGYPLSIQQLESLGCTFTLIGARQSWFEDAYYQCSCGQYWKEVFVEAMQYMGNHAHPIEQYAT
ncbi:hypothetical protein ORJ04_20840 [Rheinheimera baltica]|uniref:Phage protein n=1 Tax=Rheinheimera baltica TaxID=67576 RepID=A0ABT9I4T7_9GAMM|nr:hypothetical protein [Rheinheimera baltica]MDP5138400.1 hypothetical protein [Rheinheimera baltica]MDP5148843.1 hypothetical protein [Rheinheimera baltica]